MASFQYLFGIPAWLMRLLNETVSVLPVLFFSQWQGIDHDQLHFRR